MLSPLCLPLSRYRMMDPRLSGLVLVVGLLVGGCVQTATLPAQQLASGDAVVAAGLDEPGVLYVPRLKGQFTQGFGAGDVTATFGGPPVGGGLTGRYYLGDGLNVELEAQVARVQDEWTRLALLGIQSVPSPDDASLYLGAQAGVLHGREVSFSGTTSVHRRPLVGGTIGYGPIDLGGSWRMQVELEANVPIPPSEEEGPLPPVHLSVGVFHIFE